MSGEEGAAEKESGIEAEKKEYGQGKIIVHVHIDSVSNNLE
jgi:hypothetical protein